MPGIESHSERRAANVPRRGRSESYLQDPQSDWHRSPRPRLVGSSSASFQNHFCYLEIENGVDVDAICRLHNERHGGREEETPRTFPEVPRAHQINGTVLAVDLAKILAWEI